MAEGKSPVGFIGLGAMGFGMASTLVREGYPVKGFDISESILEKFRKVGGTTSTSPAGAVENRKICVCMVATPRQAQAVLLDGDNPVVPALPTGAMLLLCSTVPSGYVQGLGKEIADRGRPDVHLIDCPVSGGAIRAASGALSIMAGATPQAISMGREVLQAMSDQTKLYIVEGGIGAGSNMKMCHQVLASNQILVASEAMGLASHLGLDLKSLGGHVIDSDGWSWMLENRLPRILDPSQPLASAVTIILKDTSIITSEARRAGFPCHMTAIAEQVYFYGLGRGYGSHDDSSLVRLYKEGKDKVGPVKGAFEDEKAKTGLIINLLRGVHLCAAAETLAFAHHLGLDLNQVYDLCVHAAGGSRIFSKLGPGMIQALNERTSLENPAGGANNTDLLKMFEELEESVNEAQRLKAPVFLGTQALHLLRRGLQTGRGSESIVAVWF